MDEDISLPSRGFKPRLSIFAKVFLHYLLLIWIHVLVFWYFPILGTDNMINEKYCSDKWSSTRCNNYQINVFSIIFYIIYLTYFIVNAI